MEKRPRTMTEKGSAFKEELLERDYRLAIREWRKQINKVRNIVADLHESETVRHERSFLETRFEIIASAFERISEFLQTQDESRLNAATKEFDELDKENSDALKLANERIIDIRDNDDRRSRVTSKSSRASRQEYDLKPSKIQIAQEVARLKASIKFAEEESEKKAAFRRSQDDLERLRLTKSYEIRRAQLNAMLEMENEEDVDLPEENCSQSKLNEYLETQLKAVTQLPDLSISEDNHVTQSTILTNAQNQHPFQRPMTEFPVTKSTTERNTRVTFSQVENKGTISSSNPFRPTVIPSKNPFVQSTPISNPFYRQHILDSPLEFTAIAPDPLVPIFSSANEPHKWEQPLDIFNDEGNGMSLSNEAKTQDQFTSSYPMQKASFRNLTPQAFTETSNYSQHAPPQVPQEDTLSKLANLLIERRSRDSLPLPEPETFRGDLLHYPRWLKSFETIVEGQTKRVSERLYYLGRYTAGEAKEAIKGYVNQDNEQAYNEAKAVLRDRYGNPFLVADAYRRKINEWPKIQSNDGEGLRKFSDFLNQTLSAMRTVSFLSSLNDPEENQKMTRKLPSYMMNRWGRVVDGWLTGCHTANLLHDSVNESPSYPPFSEFCKFVEKEARIACNPIISHRAFKSKEDHGDNAEQQRKRNRPPATRNAGVFKISTERAPEEATKIERRPSCAMCNQEHYLEFCKRFLELSQPKRKEFVIKDGRCLGCLRRGHKNKDCRRKRICQKCQGPHPTPLHDDAFVPRKGQPDTNIKPTESSNSNRIESLTQDGECCETTSLIVPVWLSHEENPEQRLLVYALLDDQSDSCFVKSSVVDKLSLTAPDIKLKLSTMLEERVIDCKKVSGLMVQGLNETSKIKLPGAYSRDEIPARRTQIPKPETALRWPHLESIACELMPYKEDIDVGLLIGTNCTRAIKPLDIIPGKEDDPYGQKTALGWGIVGSVNTTRTIMAESKIDGAKCRFSFRTQTKEMVSPQQVKQMFELDFVEKTATENNLERSLSRDERKFLKTLENNIRLDDSGHYEMPLPFKDEVCKLPNNRQAAVNRLNGLKRRMTADPSYKERYTQFMSDLIKKGHAEKVPEEEVNVSTGRVWYIPHHGVYHPKKPDKIRVVFDASAQYQGRSLNQSLLPSPDLTNNLTGVLCRFRKENTAIMCDIEGMFLQVKVRPDHRNYLRFLWWRDGDTDKDVSEYRMTVHLFGAGSSPGCANFALKRTANDNEARFGSDAADFVKNDFYVDDGLRSVSSTQEAIELIENTRAMCQAGGFKLHKFLSNNKEVISGLPIDERAKGIQDIDLTKDILPVERALGVQWLVESDQFQFKIEQRNKPLTRRSILSTVSSIFDPLGLVSPFVLKGKQILQQLCRDGIEWDERLPDPLYVDWQRWNEDLARLSELTVPRCYQPTDFGELLHVELHNFSDACLSGYGQCSYLRMVDTSNKVHCCLVMAKSRVTPLKPVTVPRLELAAALVSVNISAFLKKELKYDSINEYFYTDSKVVLGYISNDARRFHTYVANRVQQIRDLTSPTQWRYVASSDNPADEASRGLSATELINDNRWWNGSAFLWVEENKLSPHEVVAEISPDDPEVKKASAFKIEAKEQFDLERRIKRFSDWHKAKRGIAACMKLQKKFKGAVDQHTPSPSSSACIDVAALYRAEQEIVKDIQARNFTEEICALRNNTMIRKGSTILPLDPFLDQEGILRVGGRLDNAATLEYEARRPVILPKRGHVTDLVIRHFHERTSHQGRARTLAEIRSSGYWIVGGSSAIGHHISKCVACIKMRGATQLQKMANLPEDRTTEAPPFTYCAVDCFGPFIVKEGRKQMKRYGVLFTCLSSRAIHIETAASLTTDSFISAYRRFVGRRGPARQLRSDQGTNFVGAKNELRAALAEFNDAKIADELQKDNCDWVSVKMNVPHASHMGGVWERQIRTVRSVLASLLLQHGSQLDDESLNTFMVEAEAIVNSRPLTTDSLMSPDELGVLSPNKLLTQKSTVVLPPPGNFQQADLYSRKRWRRVQYIANQFWIRWRKDYLQTLQQRQKWLRPSKNLQVGDIVLLKEDNLPRNKWRLARIDATTPSEDGLVRKVKLRTANSCKDRRFLERPITKLVLLVSEDTVAV